MAAPVVPATVTIETVNAANSVEDIRRREEDGEDGSGVGGTGVGGPAGNLSVEVHAPHGACGGAVLAARLVPLEGFSNREPLVVHCYGVMRMDPAVTGLFSSFKSKFTGVTVTPLEKLFFCAKAEISPVELETVKPGSEISLVIPLPESLPPTYRGILLKYTYALQAIQASHIQKTPFRVLPSTSLFRKGQKCRAWPDRTGIEGNITWEKHDEKILYPEKVEDSGFKSGIDFRVFKCTDEAIFSYSNSDDQQTRSFNIRIDELLLLKLGVFLTTSCVAKDESNEDSKQACAAIGSLIKGTLDLRESDQTLGCQHVNIYLVVWEVVDPKDVKPESSASILKRSHVLAENTLITKDAMFDSFEISIPKDTTPSFQSDGLEVTYSLNFHFGVSRKGQQEVVETQWSLPIVVTP